MLAKLGLKAAVSRQPRAAQKVATGPPPQWPQPLSHMPGKGSLWLPCRPRPRRRRQPAGLCPTPSRPVLTGRLDGCKGAGAPRRPTGLPAAVGSPDLGWPGPALQTALQYLRPQGLPHRGQWGDPSTWGTPAPKSKPISCCVCCGPLASLGLAGLWPGQWCQGGALGCRGAAWPSAPSP